MSRVGTSQPLRQRAEPFRDRDYLDYLRTQPCIVSGARGHDIDPAHIGTLGKGVKFHDWGALPLRNDLHIGEAHGKGEMTFWRDKLSDDDLRAALRAWAKEMYNDYLMVKERK